MTIQRHQDQWTDSLFFFTAGRSRRDPSKVLPQFRHPDAGPAKSLKHDIQDINFSIYGESPRFAEELRKVPFLFKVAPDKSKLRLKKQKQGNCHSSLTSPVRTKRFKRYPLELYPLAAVYGNHQVFSRLMEGRIKLAAFGIKAGTFKRFSELYDFIAKKRAKIEAEIIKEAKYAYTYLNDGLEWGLGELEFSLAEINPKNIDEALTYLELVANTYIDNIGRSKRDHSYKFVASEHYQERAKIGLDLLIEMIRNGQIPGHEKIMENNNINELIELLKTLTSHLSNGRCSARSSFANQLLQMQVIDEDINLEFGADRKKALTSDLLDYGNYYQRLVERNGKDDIQFQERAGRETIKLSKVEGSEITHTDPKEFPKIKSIIEHLYSKLLELKEEPGSEQKLYISDIYFWTANACFSGRGSAAISDACLEAMARAYNIKTCKAKKNISLDLEAMLTRRKRYVRKLAHGHYGRIAA